jgi:hypothetical protein
MRGEICVRLSLDVAFQTEFLDGSALHVAGQPLTAPTPRAPKPTPNHPLPVLQEDLSATCVVKESTWTMEDGVLLFTLTKARKAETWPSVFKGHGKLDTAAEAEAHRKMLLERFNEENPGFDFSNAQINGTVPDPRTFMGGPGTGRG